MTNKFSVSLACILCFAWLVTLSSPAPGRADTTYLFTASPTPAASAAGIPGFTLTYLDTDGDSLFSLDELISFSGFYTYSQDFNGNSHTWHWTTITGVPPQETNPSSPWYSLFTDGINNPYGWYMSGLHWSTYFPNPTAAYAQYQQDTWVETQVPVPIPPTALLLGAGLIPLAWARRKKRLG
jgi:hypothetical protein